MSDIQEPRQRGSIIKYAIRWKNHPMYKGIDMYWDGSFLLDGSPVSTGSSSINDAHMLSSVEDAAAIVAKLSTPEGHLPADIIGLRRTVSWSIV